LNRGKGNKHDAFTAFALELEAFIPHFGDELTALAARRAALWRVDGLASEIAHISGAGCNEIENDY
jgi:hypothetical protein